MTDRTETEHFVGIIPCSNDGSHIVLTMEPALSQGQLIRYGYSTIRVDDVQRWTTLLLDMNMRVSFERNVDPQGTVEMELEGTHPMFELLSLNPSVIMVDPSV